MDIVRRRAQTQAAFRRRWIARLATILVVAGSANVLWHRYRRPPTAAISYDPPPTGPAPLPPPKPVFYGPAWPPTDEDWSIAFANSEWTYPLPGPARRPARVDDRILEGRDSSDHHPPVCHDPGRCGVDLGGPLWGEHVYAVHDGIVDHVQHANGDERGGVYLRLAHFGGMVFTHYFHLAAVPRTIVRGAEVRAGELIGLVGDTGTEHPGRYIHFALSVRPSRDFPDTFWDPTPLLSRWPLRVPSRGTVAGFAPPVSELQPPAIHRPAK